MKQNNSESGSSIGLWLTCPKRYEYEYVKGYKQPESDALKFGTAIHKEIEGFNKGLLSRCFSKEGLIAGKWKDYWTNSDSIYRQQNLEFLEVEKEWHFELNNKTLVGKRDGYVKHVSGKHFLYELKTATARDQDNYIRQLEGNAQISNNMLALEHEGKPVDGTIYDIIWKPAIRLKKSETEEEFDERFVNEYDNGDKYFVRLVVFRKQENLQSHYDDTVHILEAMQSAYYYRNSTGCMKYNKLCPYFDACHDDNDDMLVGLDKKERKHEELSEGVQYENTINKNNQE